MEDQANKVFDEAIDKLKEANEELCRPEEDIVSFVVCKNSQFAIENFLKGFLLQNNIDINKYKTIDNLYTQCLKIKQEI